MGKTCFFVTPIGKAGTEKRRDSDRVFESIIRRRAIKKDLKPSVETSYLTAGKSRRY